MQFLRATSRARAGARGFTIMECALTTVIVGVAVVALVKLALASTQQNRYAQRMTIGAILADNIHEMMAGLPFNDPASGTTSAVGPDTGETSLASFDDVDDFDGWDSTVRVDLASGAPVGVVDANRQVITDTINGAVVVPPEWAGWRQQITVDAVDPNNLSVTLPKTNTARTCVRVTVTISFAAPGTSNWETVTTLRWLKAKT